ncbi:MAG: 4-amino-4-deoxy-L-arabinose transferase-like glycosyltransferase [Planctomycetota bacterium]
MIAQDSEPLPARKSRSHWIALGILCVLSVALRIGVVQQFETSHPLANQLVIDEQSYDEWGVRIAEGDWLGDEVFFQEPLYPYFLGGLYTIFGHDLHLARLVQCLLGGLTMVLLWFLAWRLFGPWAAWVAALAWSLYPTALLMPCLLLKPNLFLPLLAGFLLVLLQSQRGYRMWLGAGVLAALGALLRGNFLILLPLLALLPFLRMRLQGLQLSAALRSSGVFVLGVSLVLLPVMLRNWYVGDVFALTTSGAGTNVYGGNNADNPFGVATEFDWVRGIPRYEADDWRREAQTRLGHELDGSESSSYWLGQVEMSIQNDPALHLSIFWNKFRLALGAYEVPDNHHLEWDARYVPLLRLPWPGFSLWGSLGLAGILWAAYKRELRGTRLELALLFLFYLGTIVLTVMSMRARLPLLVLLLPFSGYWCASLASQLGAGVPSRTKSVLPALVLAIVAALFVNAPVFDDQTLARDLADRDYNLAVSQLDRSGELDSAARLSAELAELYPHTSRFQTLLATTEWRRGRSLLDGGNVQAGQGLIRAALERLQPISAAESVSVRERSRALRLAAYIQADLGNWSVAERFFRRAREFASGDLELKVSHAQALLELAASPEQEGSAKRTEARLLLQAVIDEQPDSLEAEGARELLARD